MIVVRNVFHIQPDQMQKAKTLVKEARGILKSQGYTSVRAMTDLVGDFYTLVVEHEVKSVGDFESSMKKMQANRKWQKFYPKLRKLMLDGYREIFTVVD